MAANLMDNLSFSIFILLDFIMEYKCNELNCSNIASCKFSYIWSLLSAIWKNGTLTGP